MYNERLKIRFLKEEFSDDEERYEFFTKVFETFAPYEQEIDEDLCRMPREWLHKFVREVLAGMVRSVQKRYLSALRRYGAWCRSNQSDTGARIYLRELRSNIAFDLSRRVPEEERQQTFGPEQESGQPASADAVQEDQGDREEEAAAKFAANPTHLNMLLDLILPMEHPRTVAGIHRAYLWLAFSGVPLARVFELKSGSMEFDTMSILYKGRVFPIYRESLPVLRAAAESTSLRYTHKMVSTRDRQRADGDSVLRGFTEPSRDLIASAIMKSEVSLRKSGGPFVRLSYRTVYLSGIFYRMYEKERAGYPVDFSLEVMDYFTYEYEGAELTKTTIRGKMNVREKELLKGYQEWKRCFRP